MQYFRGQAPKGANNSAGLKWCFSFSPADEGDVWGGNEIEGEGEYFREILPLVVFSALLKMSQKVSMCPGDSFDCTVFMAWPGSPNLQAVIIQAAPTNCDGYC